VSLVVFILYLKAGSLNHQLLCLVVLVEKEIFVSWKGDLHNGNCLSLASFWWCVVIDTCMKTSLDSSTRWWICCSV